MIPAFQTLRKQEARCPAGDDCALNKGAVSCFHCGRNWPPDETWNPPASEAALSDYIRRTIATIRNHRDADNCWPQWANVLADEVERLEARLAEAERALREIESAPWSSLDAYDVLADVQGIARAALPPESETTK